MFMKCWIVKVPAWRPRSVTKLVCRIKKNGGRTRYASMTLVSKNNI
jgi:hypothetical protein